MTQGQASIRKGDTNRVRISLRAYSGYNKWLKLYGRCPIEYCGVRVWFWQKHQHLVDLKSHSGAKAR